MIFRRFTSFLTSLCSVLLMLGVAQIQAQNLYDYKHSLKFAHHLYKSGQYQYAAQEFERILQMDSSTSDTIKLSLFKSYRKAEQVDLGVQRFHQIYSHPYEVVAPISLEYINLLLEKKNYHSLRNFIDSSHTLSKVDKNTARIHMALLNKEWDAAQAIYNRQDSTTYPPLNDYHTIIKDAQNRKYRSAVLATGLSAIVPGLGKVYTGRWKDGLMSFIIVGVNAWQAYRGFRLKGTDNAYGWIFGSIGFAFYVGNLYGSAKSAIQFNRNVENKLQHRAQDTWQKHY